MSTLQTLGRALLTGLTAISLSSTALADPCGMVPPAWVPNVVDAPAIQRSGDQITYAFFKDGIQTLVLRPGFTGNIDEFGMLIPFPSPPSLRKTPDNTFEQLAAAVDPPQMTVNIQSYPRPVATRSYGGLGRRMQKSSVAEPASAPLRFDEVRIVNQEAVGMYEIAVIQAGSSHALNTWMTDQNFRYPEGMDTVIDEYVAIQWTFVAIKAAVGQMPGVAPTPGMVGVNSALPAGATFSGHVQGMGFRFEVDEPVIPMRLAAFNDASSRNLIYFLSDTPLRAEQHSAKLVQRQLPGTELKSNLFDPLALVVNGGRLKPAELEQLAAQRDPGQYVSTARELFSADLAAATTGELTLAFESYEKELLNISESLGMRGTSIDSLHASAVVIKKNDALTDALASLDDMTLTVLDGAFNAETLGTDNMTFASWRMDESQNNANHWTRRPAGPFATIYR